MQGTHNIIAKYLFYWYFSEHVIIIFENYSINKFSSDLRTVFTSSIILIFSYHEEIHIICLEVKNTCYIVTLDYNKQNK